MKFRSAVFSLLVLMLFTLACSERSVTGVDGWSTVSGQVTLASGQGDVAGIEVSAEGTGLAVKTDQNGRFELLGVPSKVTLNFRRGDQINDRIEVSAGSNLNVVVGNSSSGRRRGVGHAGVEIEGTIVSVSPSELVVRTARETHTVVINESTVIRHGNRVLTVADLLPGDRVHVKARRDGERLIAVEIKRQEGEEGDDDESSKVEIEGTVTAISAASITVHNNRGDQTAAIVASTVIRKGNRTLTVADIPVGSRVHVKAQRAADSTLVATEIKLQNEADSDDDHGTKVEIEGTVSAISAASITVHNNRGDQTAAIVASTVIRKGNRNLTVADIPIGSRVHVKAQRAADNTLVATEIKLQNEGESDDDDDNESTKVEIEGTVTAISATSITVRSNHGSQTAAIVASTVIRKGHTRLTVAEVPIGSRVHVKAQRAADASLTATEIIVQNS